MVVAGALTLKGACLGIRAATKAEDQRFIERVTGLPWPAGASHVVIEDDPSLIHPSWMRAYLHVPEHERAAFAARYDFAPPRQIASCTEEGPTFFITLLQGYPPLPCPSPRLYERKGNITGDNDFEMVFDKTSGGLWIFVTYPD